MLMGESFAGSADLKRARSPARQLAAIALLLGIAACNPVETWRDLTGVSRNDPDPDTTPNTKNLAAGEASDYPNLATVPPPPVRALTAAEREKLTQSLVADRANARHTNEQLRAGFSSAAAAPPPPGEPAEQPAQVAAAPPSPPALSSAAPAPSTASASAAPIGEQPVKPPPGPSAAPALASTPQSIGSAGRQPMSVAAATAPHAARGGGKGPSEPGQGLRKQGEPPEPGPMESSLEVPQARATPDPEQIQPAPPPPQLPPTPKVAAAPTPLAGGLAAGGALAPLPLPEAKSSAGYQPPPTAPALPSPEPTRTAAASPGKSAKPPLRAATPVAEIKFGGDSTSLTEKDRQTLETVLPVYQQSPGKVRVVGYAGAGSGAVEQLNSYKAALDRAQAVAAALTKAGIPSDKVQVEAAPQGENSGESRAEVLLEH